MLASSPVLSANAVRIGIPPVQRVLLPLIALLERAYGRYPDDPKEIASVIELLEEVGTGLIQ
jgi:hypothetical protein